MKTHIHQTPHLTFAHTSCASFTEVRRIFNVIKGPDAESYTLCKEAVTLRSDLPKKLIDSAHQEEGRVAQDFGTTLARNASERYPNLTEAAAQTIADAALEEWRQWNGIEGGMDGKIDLILDAAEPAMAKHLTSEARATDEEGRQLDVQIVDVVANMEGKGFTHIDMGDHELARTDLQRVLPKECRIETSDIGLDIHLPRSYTVTIFDKDYRTQLSPDRKTISVSGNAKDQISVRKGRDEDTYSISDKDGGRVEFSVSKP